MPYPTPYLGAFHSVEAIRAALDAAGDDITFEYEAGTPACVAANLADDHVIAWFDGCSEAGPRPIFDDVDRRMFRLAASRFATGITVVTTQTPEGPWGMTVSAFLSVSLEPLLVMVSLSRDSRMRRALSKLQMFSISVLSESQQLEAQRFADSQRLPGPPSFDGIATFATPVSRCPALTGARAVFDCQIMVIHTAGDHDLVLGEVLWFIRHDHAGPLVFVDGEYRAITKA